MLLLCLLCTDICGQEEGSCGPDLCRCPCRRGEVTEFFTLRAISLQNNWCFGRTYAVIICTWVPLKRCVFLSKPCPHLESLIVFCPVSASVCWELTELERRRPSKCWLVTLMSPLGKPLWRVTGACQSKMSLVDRTVQGWIRCHLVYSAQMGDEQPYDYLPILCPCK